MPLDSAPVPASPFDLPSDNKALLKVAFDLIEACRSSQGIRAAFYRQLNAMVETGRQDGTRSIINKLYRHVDRMQSHLYSPTELRFTVDFENHYEEEIQKRAAMAARLLTRDWERNNTDIIFGQGVFESLKYGASILKQWVQQEGADKLPVYYKKLVMPWQFGVIREDENDLSRQSAMCETVMLTLPEVWRRIYHLPDANRLYQRIKSNAARGGSGDEYNSFFHQVLSTATLQTGVQASTRPMPGGIVQLNNSPNMSIVAPEIGVDLVRFHELWIWGPRDYVTIQIIEPDILVTQFKRTNLLISGDEHSGRHPYTLIQPNQTHGNIWGRSEIMDLVDPQELLSQWTDDAKRLFGLQIDKIIAFAGFDGLTDENYDQMRAAGYFGMPPGATATDMTPKMPEQTIPMIKFMMEIIDQLGGFSAIMGGQGEPGVRAGEHADTLVKMASPHLRDRSLLVERQCAAAGDLRLAIMEAKDGRHYWTNPKDIENTRFLLNDLPDDRRVSVDSHSSSPIFADNHQNLISWAAKMGYVDGESVIEDLPFPGKDAKIQRYQKKMTQQAEMLKKLEHDDPVAFAKVVSGKGKGGHR